MRSQRNHDKMGMLLVFGASCFEEACRPLAVEALRLALMPTTDQMRCASPCPCPVAAHHGLFKDSTISIVASPGMMTGATLGGANAEQAARLQINHYIHVTSASCSLMHPRDPVYVMCVSTRHITMITSMATALTLRGILCSGSALAVAPSGPSSAPSCVQNIPVFVLLDS
jgi:hypothetical protein